MPGPPTRTSLPAAPKSLSLPPLPSILSARGLPRNVSLPAVPLIVAAQTEPARSPAAIAAVSAIGRTTNSQHDPLPRLLIGQPSRPELASYLWIEERDLEAGGRN